VASPGAKIKLRYPFKTACGERAGTSGVAETDTRTRGPDPMDIIRIILAIILPPVGVFMQVGFGKHFWINIILTLFGYIPGIIHAIWVIAKY
jgi:uncharacterized membrane protein YqaE (UPF0057 family)